MNRSYAFPVFLIATGAILLLYQFDLFDLSLAYIIILGSVIIGGFLLNKAFNTPARQGLLGGSFFMKK